MILLDVDGVILDSNQLKSEAIFQATLKFTNHETAREFTNYFTALNGVPREIKINHYFAESSINGKILEAYNDLLRDSAKDVKMTEGAIEFLELKSKETTLVALSGASHSELVSIFKSLRINQFFSQIFGGPTSKTENIENIDTSKVKYYVGDSIVDYELALANNIPFIFMNGYTQIDNWEELFRKDNKVKIIKNLTEI